MAPSQRGSSRCLQRTHTPVFMLACKCQTTLANLNNAPNLSRPGNYFQRRRSQSDEFTGRLMATRCGCPWSGFMEILAKTKPHQIGRCHLRILEKVTQGCSRNFSTLQPRTKRGLLSTIRNRRRTRGGATCTDIYLTTARYRERITKIKFPRLILSMKRRRETVS